MYKYNAVAEKVFNFVPSIPFDEEGYFTEEDVDYLISDILTDEFNYETGATKCVIIPDDTDFVIKIPFNATISSCENCEHYDPHSYCNCSRCPNCSFKNGGGPNHDNYCALEEEIYNTIKKKYNQFIDFFLPVEKVCEVDDYPIYTQKKAEIFENKVYPTSENSKEKVKSCDSLVTAPVEWLAKCLEDMNNDLDMYNDFLDMLIALDINADLHRGNVGYYNGHAVLIDYAGFKDN